MTSFRDKLMARKYKLCMSTLTTGKGMELLDYALSMSCFIHNRKFHCSQHISQTEESSLNLCIPMWKPANVSAPNWASHTFPRNLIVPHTRDQTRVTHKTAHYANFSSHYAIYAHRSAPSLSIPSCHLLYLIIICSPFRPL